MKSAEGKLHIHRLLEKIKFIIQYLFSRMFFYSRAIRNFIKVPRKRLKKRGIASIVYTFVFFVFGLKRIAETTGQGCDPVDQGVAFEKGAPARKEGGFRSGAFRVRWHARCMFAPFVCIRRIRENVFKIVHIVFFNNIFIFIFNRGLIIST